MKFFSRLALPVLLLACGLAAQDIASFEKRITVQKLENGLTVLVLERPEAPVFSFYTLVDTGSAHDPMGQSGMAHMFEHMAFKGTDKIGTTNYEAEKAALAMVEKAFDAWTAADRQEVGRDQARVAALKKELDAAIADANQYVVQNEFGELIERNGAMGLNATTYMDQTVYYYSLPANRLEMWAYLESERFLKPVMREFYKERDVVAEERRMRTDSNPVGKLVEQFLAAAYTAHTYGRSGVGWPSELHNISATEAMDFYKRFYVPSNMMLAVVGDVKAAQVMPVVQKYFGRLPAAPKPAPMVTVEPKQQSERVVILRERAQPVYIEGYHRPDYRHPDDAVYDVIGDLLSNGRTSRLYRTLVRDKQIAAAAAGFSGFPGTRYPNLFAFYAFPLPGHTPQEMGEAFAAEIEKLKTQDVTDEELRMVKTRAKADVLRQLDDNGGLAEQIAIAQARYGDWRELFRWAERIDKVTKADVRRVANSTFTSSNRTVGMIENVKAAPAAAKGDQQ